MKNDDMVDEFKLTNKNLEKSKEDLIKQKIKLEKINDIVDTNTEKLRTTNMYINGFTSIFGFFGNLFSFGSNNKLDENNNINKRQISNELKVDELNYIDDPLEKEILQINKNAKEINNLIRQTSTDIKILDEKMDKNNKKIEILDKKAQDVLK